MNEYSERARPYSEKLQKLAPIVREHADRAEREARRPREVVDALYEAVHVSHTPAAHDAGR
jgi:hypothetical protein